MAGRSLGTLTLDLIAKVGGFIAGLDKADRALKQRTKSMNVTAIAFGTAIGKFMTDAIVKLGQSIPAVIDRMDEISKAAKTVGMSTEGFSRLSFAADLANVSQQELQSGLGRLVKAQAAAMDATSKQAKMFAALGIAVKDASGAMRPTRDVMLDFADVFSQLKGSPEALAAGLEIFGRGFQTLVPLINDGSDALKRAEQEADDLGITLSTSAGLAAEEFNDNLERLKTATGAVAQQVAVDLLPELVALTAEMVKFAKEGREGGGVANSIADSFRFMGQSASFAIDSVRALTSTAIGLYGVLQKMSTLNPGYVMARLFGGANNVDVSTAFDQAADFGRRGASQRIMPFNSPSSMVPSAGDDSETAARLRAVLSEGGGKGKKAKKEMSEAEKAAKALEEAYQRMNAQMKEQIALFGQTSEVAKVRYDIEHGELSKLSEAKQKELLQGAAILDQLKAEEKLLDERNKAEEKRLEVINEAHEALGDLLSDMQFELDLMGKSNAERIAEIELRRIGIGLTEEERAAAKVAIKAKAEEIEQMEKSIAAMDDFRSSLEDTFVSIFDGSKSAKEAFKDLADSIIQQMLRIAAQRLVAQMFGEQGQAGGGWFGALFNAAASAYGGSSGSTASNSGSMVSWIGSGYAEGTDFAPGGMALVGEHGPEIVNLPRGSQVIPNDESRRMMGGQTLIFNQNYAAPQDPRTPRQMAASVAFETRRAMQRSGA